MLKKGIASALTTLAVASTITAADLKRPNVVLILTDDENFDTLSCYGGKVKTPYIDSIAKNGVKFTNFNVVHSICSPSRYAILTGRYYDNCSSPDFLQLYPKGKASCVTNFITLEKDGFNVPSVLRNDGYITGYVGKFHLTDHHLLRNSKEWEKNGLQQYRMLADPKENRAANRKMHDNHQFWVDKIKQYGFDYVNGVYSANLRELFNKKLEAHNVEWTTDAALQFLKQQKGGKKPFFLMVATTYPHGPAPERMIDNKYKFSLDNDVQLTGEGYVTNRDLSKVLPDREQYKKLRGISAKAPTAAWWDAAVGAIIKQLKASGEYENTLIIYTSDHGKLGFRKTTLYEDGVHVPLLMQWPAVIKPGTVYRHVVGSVDIAPTVLSVCNAKIPSGYQLDGVSLKPVLEGKPKPVRDALFMAMGYAHGIKTDHYKYIAVRYPVEVEKQINEGKTFKGKKGDPPLPQPYLILHQQLAQKAASKCKNYFARNQLYDLSKDPGEENNIYKSSPETAAKMRALLARESKRLFPHRPFGEFGAAGATNKVFDNASRAIWYPASTAQLKITSEAVGRRNQQTVGSAK